jgi:uncharacterized protein (TIGR00661 family)
MRILYGVQATGQGHISRARAMAGALQDNGVAVTWLFSGRPRERLFDMEPFDDYLHRDGLSFVTRSGRIRYRATIAGNNLAQFARDASRLNLSRYDAVVTDFEPVTAWAGRLAGVRTIGIGHQYAFGRETPKAGHRWWTELIMRNFAPVTLPLGLHWHPYAANVLPPILDLPELRAEPEDHFLVYLPFEDQAAVTALLRQLHGYRFAQYAPGLSAQILGNVRHCPPSITGFKHDLASSRGVICNSGFELISECLHWGKPVFTKPLRGQMEQLSNALALQQLGYATVSDRLSAEKLSSWLSAPQTPAARPFADVATALAQWLAAGATAPALQLSQDLWRQTNSSGTALHANAPPLRRIPLPAGAVATA